MLMQNINLLHSIILDTSWKKFSNKFTLGPTTPTSSSLPISQACIWIITSPKISPTSH